MKAKRLLVPVGIAVVLMALCWVGIATSSAAKPDSRPSRTTQSPTAPTANLLVATTADYPPMEYISGTQLVGHDIDLMNAIAAEISVTVTYTDVPWSGIFDGLIAGEYDAVIAALTVTPEREEVIDFTLPYVTVGTPPSDERWAIAVQQGDDVIRHQINEALCHLRIDGTLETIIAVIANDKPEWQPHMPGWSCSSVPTDTESTLVYYDTQGSPTVVQVPAGAVSETTTLVYAPVETVTAPSNFFFAGYAFDLDAYQDGSLLPGFAFSVPVTVTLHYTEADIAGLDEDSLVLEYWSGSGWVDAACGSYDRHPDEDWLAAPICHLSRFALFGKYTVYLPLVLRLYVTP